MGVTKYVQDFCERLSQANALAKQHLTVSQGKMKHAYDKAAVKRQFQTGDEVLVLFPVPGSSLSAEYEGPYEVHEQVGETDYIISTPNRRRKTCVCHIIMLKLYHSRP